MGLWVLVTILRQQLRAFGHLKNSTGSTGGALKALAGSIMGSGGYVL